MPGSRRPEAWKREALCARRVIRPGARPTGAEYEQLNNGLVGGNGVWPGTAWLAANVPGWTAYTISDALHQSRYLSDEGRLFFNSDDALVPQAVNHNEDVYEYEPPASSETADNDTCTTASPAYSERSGGCVSLISAGTSLDESAFLDASENGDDVFFLTAEKLVPQDVDTALDVYDAHVCTSREPCFEEVTSPPACASAEACRAAPSPQPSVFGAPASATFSGPGNLVPDASPPAPPPAKPTAAQVRAKELAKALKACKKDRAKGRRTGCEKSARKRYGAGKANNSDHGKGK